MNATAKGEVSESAILAKLVSLGYVVLLPFGNNQRYDMVVDKGQGFLKVQCKTGKLKDGCVHAFLKNTDYAGRQRIYRGEVDLLMIYCPQNNTCYEIDANKIRARVVLRIDQPKKGVKRYKHDIRWAKDYEIK